MLRLIKLSVSTFIFTFSLQLFAQSNEELASFWLSLRFESCGEGFSDEIALQNANTLKNASNIDCKNVKLSDTNNAQTQKCFKALNAALQIYISKNHRDRDYSCVESAGFKAYLEGDKTPLKPAEVIPNAINVCFEADKKDFLYASIDNRNTCTKKFNCRSKSTFGSAVLESGTYFLRCLPEEGAPSEKSCSAMTFNKCAGHEDSFAQMSYGGMLKSDSVLVKPSKKAQ